MAPDSAPGEPARSQGVGYAVWVGGLSILVLLLLRLGASAHWDLDAARLLVEHMGVARTTWGLTGGLVPLALTCGLVLTASRVWGDRSPLVVRFLWLVGLGIALVTVSRAAALPFGACLLATLSVHRRGRPHLLAIACLVLLVGIGAVVRADRWPNSTTVVLGSEDRRDARVLAESEDTITFLDDTDRSDPVVVEQPLGDSQTVRKLTCSQPGWWSRPMIDLVNRDVDDACNDLHD